jgi:hypothetical protein
MGVMAMKYGFLDNFCHELTFFGKTEGLPPMDFFSKPPLKFDLKNLSNYVQ